MHAHPDRVAAGIVAAALLFIPQAQAQIITRPGSVQELMSCLREKIYNAKSANIPDVIAPLFANGDASFSYRVCIDPQGNAHYFVRTPMTVSPDICRVQEQEIFVGKPENVAYPNHMVDGYRKQETLPGWKDVPPPAWQALHYPLHRQTDLALISDHGCPRTDDANYSPVGSISDGTMREFSRLWRDAVSSPHAFEAAFAHVAMKRFSTQPLGQPQDKGTGEWVRRMEHILFGPTGNSQKTLWGWDCNTDCHVSFGGYGIVYFDVGSSGLTITSVDYQIQI